ncbi:hypothetical protein UFOVP328_284 [uncultured Caudovirales phage]|uniref:Uncharacterized protein n=1 Tax=uncultured Caudovirales phage TaxID=2100421 RepID=A0A6J5LVE8_9CAUD|nr:hypothetical protein UFOVP328_284 [uncultured Caudovirales phage]
MRASEFITEDRVGKVGHRRQQATVGLNKFRHPDKADRVYELNRVMMAAASTDGTFVPDIDQESWVGRHNIATPYTREEQEKLEKAFKAVGSDYEDLNSGDYYSQEVESTNKTSPVKGFKGYPR